MSAIGYPDYQRITQWLGSPLVTHDALVIGLGPHVDGPLEVANFAAVIVALKATGGAVTVTVKQTIQGGPAAVVLSQQVVVAAGATLFEAFVLYGTAVEVDLAGSVVGTSVDYALYGSNTTTNAQVITAATINVQQNEVLVAAEPTLDFVDAVANAWSIVDDAPNTRVKITPPRVLTGRATGAGAKVAGTGWTIVRNSVGNYTVTYTAAYGAAPCVMVTPASGGSLGGATSPILIAQAAGSFTVEFYDDFHAAFADTDFSFLVFPLT